MCNTPVLLLIFNRPDTTQKVFEAIRQAKPAQLFIAADGPRDNNESDIEKCAQARKIATTVDWDCEVKTFFRNENRGCGHAPAEAISWFFEHVEQGIILEDDILPSQSFFTFCEELLEKYKHDTTIMSIGGSNFLSTSFQVKDSYIFSDYSGSWGWASWRRAWQGYDHNISSWTDKKNKEYLQQKFLPEQFLLLENIFNRVCNKNVADIWDFQWWYRRLLSGGFGIIPVVNLTKNIGFDAQATHTFTIGTEIKNAPLEQIIFPLVHPAQQLVNKEYDRLLSKKYYWQDASANSITKRIIAKLNSMVGNTTTK
ncbi:MAG TPA: hypothetical protein VK559_12180 [Ferruginibacter sp.]|nr:hypothetical protein [Ferruginibacter sp.]